MTNMAASKVMGMYRPTNTNGKIVVRNSAFGGYEVHYGNIHLPYNYEQLPAAAIKKALPILAARSGEQPVDLVAKIEDPSIRQAMEEHLGNLLDNMKAGVPSTYQGPSQQHFQQYQEPLQKAYPQQMSVRAQPWQSQPVVYDSYVDKWKALEVLLNKSEERHDLLNEQYAKKPNLANLRKVDSVIHGYSSLIAKIEMMSEAQFNASKLPGQIGSGRINEAISELNKSADEFSKRR